MFDENITEKGDVQNIRTWCESVRIISGVAGGSDNVIVLVVVGEQGLASGVNLPRSPGYVLSVEISCQNDLLSYVEKEV
jgi:hypothetical protein